MQGYLRERSHLSLFLKLGNSTTFMKKSFAGEMLQNQSKIDLLHFSMNNGEKNWFTDTDLQKHAQSHV